MAPAGSDPVALLILYWEAGPTILMGQQGGMGTAIEL
jgi:hypothetical protein